MNWINSCKILLTHDSLGLHIAMALDKRTVALFGPTSSHEIPLTSGFALSVAERSSFACPPCYKDRCHNTIHCMEEIPIDDVENAIRIFLRGIDEQSEA